MKILVTGGAGFIGSSITRLLIQNNFEVIVYDNLSKGHEDAIDPKAEFVNGDIRNKESLEKALNGVDAIIHAAGFIVVPESVEKPELYFDNNLKGAVTVLEAMRSTKVNKIIFSSSAAVYGNPKSIPIKEEDPTFPTSPYGADKLAFEAYLAAYHNAYNIETISLRYFNAYGQGERHIPETHVIPNYISAIIKDQPIPLTGSIEQVRDFVYIDDIARAHIEALKLDGHQILNLGSGSGVKLAKLIETLEKVSGKKIKINRKPPRPGDPKELIADISKIKKLLNWEPKVGLEEGLKRTYEYIQRNI